MIELPSRRILKGIERFYRGLILFHQQLLRRILKGIERGHSEAKDLMQLTEGRILKGIESY